MTTATGRSDRQYFNEFDPWAAAWLGQLMNDGHIAPGAIDQRSIRDVTADDVRGFDICHFFAGIGGWPYALTLAGWPEDRPVWTGSCPCQPYSSAGKREGDKDERNLWPDFFRLIRECRPDTVFGEQVSSAIGHGWLDGISADLEGEGYAVGAVVLGAHSVGAPHIRQRLYWVAHSKRPQRRAGNSIGCGVGGRNGLFKRAESTVGTQPRSSVGRLANPSNRRSPKHGKESRERTIESQKHSAERTGLSCRLGDSDGDEQHGAERGTATETIRTGDDQNSNDRRGTGEPARTGVPCRVAESDEFFVRRISSAGEQPIHEQSAGTNDSPERMGKPIRSGLEGYAGDGGDGHEPGRFESIKDGSTPPASGVGYWDQYELIPCRDGKTRRLKPGLEPLAHGIPGNLVEVWAESHAGQSPPAKFPARVGLIKGYGNAIVPQVAAAFIRAFLESESANKG